jgi:DNA-binding MarR family transcriptional regulator
MMPTISRPKIANVNEGGGKKSKRLGLRPYSSLPEGVYERPDLLFHHLYIRSKKRIRQAREMREFDVNFREYLLLEMLYAAGELGIAQHVIGAYFDVKPSVTSKLIDRMEKRYFVERKLNPSNKKEKLVCLTEPYGLDFARRMLEVTDAHTEEVRAALPDGALQEFTRVALLMVRSSEV